MIIDDTRAIIVFLKPPKLGEVKTRLAADVGDEKAFEIYISLLQHTIHVLNGVNAFRYIYFSEEAPLEIDLPPRSYKAEVQKGKDLGEKMSNAFKKAFDDGATEVVIIGSDNIQITPPMIEKAFESLLSYDIVIGPSNDGGYYLLGMYEYIPELFVNIEWSTDTVYGKTVENAHDLDLRLNRLEMLSDIDHWSDVQEASWQNVINTYKENK